MYILSLDLGSTNFKVVVLKVIENDTEGEIKLVGKVRMNITDFALFICEVIKKFDININEIEKIIVTGTGSSYIGDEYNGIEILKVNEFDAIGYGGIILSKLDEALIVSIGTGTTIVHSNLDKNVRIGGTGLGGGTLVGLGRAILGNKEEINFKNLIDIAKRGDSKNVDLTIGDISKDDILDMSKDITAANFAGVSKKSNDADFIAGVVNLILENICLLVKTLDRQLPVVFIGTMVVDDYIKNRLVEISKYTKNEYVFVDNAEFAIAIGAYEYYLLRLRV